MVFFDKILVPHIMRIEFVATSLNLILAEVINDLPHDADRSVLSLVSALTLLEPVTWLVTTTSPSSALPFVKWMCPLVIPL